ncbi:MAG: tetratricopeptide repeat-containing glycosyltransferase family protein [Tepidisphaeraceae bacterium]
MQEAEQLYRQVLAQQPKHVDAMHNLAVISLQVGRYDLALDLIRRTIALNPSNPEAHYNLGKALTDMGQLHEGVTSLRQAIRLKPDYAEAHSNLGIALRGLGQFDQAIAAYREAIRLKPGFAEAHNNLGNVLRDVKQLDGAIAACRQAILLKPGYAKAHNNLGNALKDNGQLDEAIAAYRQAIRLDPGYAEAHVNLEIAYRDTGQLDKAIDSCRQAIAIKPDYAEPHFNLALSLLTSGDFQHGWQEYEWRWKCKDFPSPFAQPQWDGCLLEGRTLLLHTEQGHGDALQFIRYLPLVAERGGKIVIECYAELQRLFQTNTGRCQIVVRGQPLPVFDFHCPLLSLPRVFGTSLANIPKDVPYLHADAEDAGRWQQRLADHSPLVKVGLGWAGRPTHTNDRNRSMKLARLAPLGQAPGARFFSLQKGAAAAEAQTPPPGMELVDWTEELKDFADTAALISNLDLVIAVDTAVVHLAGAMGKPVWTLLPFNSDWRWLLERQDSPWYPTMRCWLLERQDSPWYPTMRLFRQPRIGDWDTVITRVVEALSLWIHVR